MPRVPNILHYVFGMAPDFGGKPWSLLHHVCLKSAIERIQPEQVFFHHEFEPSGPWWDLSRKLVTLVPMEAPRKVFGNPLLHVAHRAGVVRLRTLIEHGGIYLDADVFVHRSFSDLMTHSTVMGVEGQNGEYGMADAIIVAEPKSPFLTRWLEEYRWFRSLGRDQYWAEHAVEVPGRLAAEYPDEIKILPYTAFYWPLWTEDHLRWLFASDEPIDLSATYANHLWESKAWDYLKDLTPGATRATDTNFNRWAREMLAGLPDSYGTGTKSDRLKMAVYDLMTRAQALPFRLKRKAFGSKVHPKDMGRKSPNILPE